MIKKNVSYPCARAGNMKKINPKLTQSEAMALAHKEYVFVMQNKNFTEWETEWTESNQKMTYGQFIARKANKWEN